ncbi:hypothetical protein DFH06DRAFT_1316275 [Mycena polygramma]|nr:hypothetical protein DFH06DRAFT_1316275 [Mycena polygramma]
MAAARRPVPMRARGRRAKRPTTSSRPRRRLTWHAVNGPKRQPASMPIPASIQVRIASCQRWIVAALGLELPQGGLGSFSRLGEVVSSVCMIFSGGYEGTIGGAGYGGGVSRRHQARTVLLCSADYWSFRPSDDGISFTDGGAGAILGVYRGEGARQPLQDVCEMLHEHATRLAHSAKRGRARTATST